MTVWIVAAALVVAAAFVGWRYMAHRGLTGATLGCDLRRSIVVIGPDQNLEECVAQRRALKPLLIRIRQAGINVIELYGHRPPRRNGRDLEWVSGELLRRALKARMGFHLVCLDDTGEVTLHSRRAVSRAVLSELIVSEERPALPPPPGETRQPGPVPAPAGTSWSVGVLR